jgi:hypothetical protein
MANATIAGAIDAIPFVNNDRQREHFEKQGHGGAYGFGEGASLMGQALATGFGVGAVAANSAKLQAANGMASKIKNPFVRRAATNGINAAVRAVASGAGAAATEADEVIQGKQTFYNGLLSTGRSALAGAVSVLPEELLPKQGLASIAQPFAQAVTDVAFSWMVDQAAGVEYGEDETIDILGVEVPKGYLRDGIMAMGFGLNDVDLRSSKTRLNQHSFMRAEEAKKEFAQKTSREAQQRPEGVQGDQEAQPQQPGPQEPSPAASMDDVEGVSKPTMAEEPQGLSPEPSGAQPTLKLTEASQQSTAQRLFDAAKRGGQKSREHLLYLSRNAAKVRGVDVEEDGGIVEAGESQWGRYTANDEAFFRGLSEEEDLRLAEATPDAVDDYFMSLPDDERARIVTALQEEESGGMTYEQHMASLPDGSGSVEMAPDDVARNATSLRAEINKEIGRITIGGEKLRNAEIKALREHVVGMSDARGTVPKEALDALGSILQSKADNLTVTKTNYGPDYVNATTGEWDADGVKLFVAQNANISSQYGKKVGRNTPAAEGGLTDKKRKLGFSDESGDLFDGTDAADNRTAAQKAIDAELAARDKAAAAARGNDPLEGTPLFDKNVHEANATKQEDMFAGTSSKASVGAFAPRTQPKDKPAPDTDVKPDKPMQKPLEGPELVRIARDLMDGKIPALKRKLRAAGGAARGVFISPGAGGGEGKIELRADIFSSPEQALKTLSHEIGHVVDWLSDKVHGRGNILGHLASLKRHMGSYIEGEPGGPKPLTAAEKRRLKKVSEDLLTVEGEEFINESIRRETGVEPQHILDVLGQGLNDMRDSNPALYNYVAALDGKEKKAIAKMAIRGMVPEELRRFKTVVEEFTGAVTTRKVILRKPTNKEIVQKFNELFEQAVKDRQLLSRAKVMDELKALTKTWKPFDENADPKYTEYRHRPDELYADAFSVLMNEPELLAKDAPEFYRGFFNYLERKPDVKAAYERIQNYAGTDEMYTERRKDVRGMFERSRGKGNAPEKKASRADEVERFMINRVDGNYGIERLVNDAKRRGETVADKDNPLYAKRSSDYTASEQDALLAQDQRLVRELKSNGLEMGDIDELLFLERVIHERSHAFKESEVIGIAEDGSVKVNVEFKPIGNPLGFDEQSSRAQREDLRNRLGDEKFARLQDITEKFRESHKDYVVSRLIDSGMYSKSLEEYMKANDYYVTFAVAKETWGRLGNEVSGKIFGQVGTLQEIKSPLVATTLKDMQLIRAANRTMAAKSVVSFLKKHEPERIIRATEKFDKNVNAKVVDLNRSPGKDYGMIAFMQGGKVEGYWVPKTVAEAFEYNPSNADFVVKGLAKVNSFFRNMYTTYSPGFSLLFNPMRDYSETRKKLPGMNVPLTHYKEFFPDWLKGLKSGVRRAMNIDDETVNEMMRDRMLVSTHTQRGLIKDDIALEQYLVEQKLAGDTGIKRNVLNHVSKFAEAFQFVNTVMETSSKVAALRYLKRNTDWSTEKIAEHIRRHAGTPQFTVKGKKMESINALTLFVNSWKEGWRSNIEVAKERPAEYAWKTARSVVPTKTLVIAATAGLLGEELREFFDNVPEYDKKNYTVVPLKMTDDGKSVYMRLPHNEADRFFGGLYYGALKETTAAKSEGPIGFGLDVLMSLIDYSAGQLPSGSPGIAAAADIISFLSGKNPEDKFRERKAIPERIWKTGDKELIAEASLKYLWNKYGARQLFKFSSSDIVGDDKNGWFEKLLGVPVLNDAIGRLIKVTDYGRVEKEYEKKGVESQGKAKGSYDMRTAIVDHRNRIGETNRDAARALYKQLKDDGKLSEHYRKSWRRFWVRYQELSDK